jgi:hypothetical protein
MRAKRATMANILKKTSVFVWAVAAFCTLWGCVSRGRAENPGRNPIRAEDLRYPRYGDNIVPVDYRNPDNWLAAARDGQAPVDVFFLYPTSWRAAYGEYPVADINNPEMRHWAQYYLKTRASAFETAGNIYAPFYRQLDAAFVMSYAESQRLTDAIGYFAGAPLTDAIAAFDYYLEHYNRGKPFILAGHSQGSIVLSGLIALHLRDRPEVYERMIAAYLIGMPIPEAFYELFPHLKPARSADDLGVIISYNTNSPVVEGANPFSHSANILINPVSWATDGGYVPKEASKGGIIVNADGSFVEAPALADAMIDRSTGTLVTNVDRERFSSAAESRAYFPLGVLHENDITLYYYDLRANVENRVKQWFAVKALRP